MKKIKVLYIEDIGEIAGGPNSLLQLFSKIGNHVEIHLFAPDGPFAESARKYASKVTITNKTRYDQIKFFGMSVPNFYHIFLRFKESVKFFFYIKKNKIEIVHSNDLDGHITSWFLCHVFGIKVVWHIRIMTWPKVLYKIKRVSQIIFVSDAVKDFSLENQNNKNVSVIYNGINIKHFQKELDKYDYDQIRKDFKVHKDTFLLGYVSRIKDQKRQMIILKSILPLIKNGINLKVMFVGDDSVTRDIISGKENNYYNELQQFSKKNDLQNNVIFTGHQAITAKFYKIFNGFIFPAINDSNPRVILEAMASKIPIIANDTGGVMNMLEDGKYGLISEVDNVQIFSEKIKKLIHNKSAVDVNKTFTKLQKDFSLDSHAQNVLSVYKMIL
jgi:glycosyltransferase involved in cell wall biosynthesis